jgi:hypothetical protein
MRRLFAFGCSFTNYRWSTWADCLAPEFDYFENWGQAGAGNHYIFNSVMECDQRNHFGRGAQHLRLLNSVRHSNRVLSQRRKCVASGNSNRSAFRTLKLRSS